MYICNPAHASNRSNHLANGTRPCIACCLNLASQHRKTVCNPGGVHIRPSLAFRYMHLPNARPLRPVAKCAITDKRRVGTTPIVVRLGRGTKIRMGLQRLRRATAKSRKPKTEKVCIQVPAERPVLGRQWIKVATDGTS